jgi:hypothetical protein
MDNLKSLAISAGFIMLLLLFLPVLQNSVTAAGANTTAFNATNPIATTVIELSGFPILALAAGFMLMALRRAM